jgi:signal transduction histidine kinase
MSDGTGKVATQLNSVEELSQRNAALEKENYELRQAAEARAASLARLAHELRTPLTSILGFSEILLGQEQLTPAQKNFCERIQNSAQQLRASLNQLSEIYRSRVERPQTSEAEQPQREDRS